MRSQALPILAITLALSLGACGDSAAPGTNADIAAASDAETVAPAAPAPPPVPRLLPENARVEPLVAVAEIIHPQIDENSGIAFVGGAYFTHNDSGGEPTLFRGLGLDFAAAEVLPVEGATNVDWEELAVMEGDLLICDLGDNQRARDDINILRVRYIPSAPPPATHGAHLDLIARYPVAYADARHDVEGAVVVDGKLLVFTKDRGEGTLVLRFDELIDAGDLKDGERNVPTQIGRLELGDREQVTAADLDPATNTVVLLTYTQIARYPADALAGEPTATTLIGARQTEALCVRGENLVFTNEQRGVFTVESYARAAPDALLPPRPSIKLDGSAISVIDGTDEARVSCSVAGDALVVDATFQMEGPRQPTDARIDRLGTAIVVGLASHDHRQVGEEDRVFALGTDAEGAPALFRVHFDATRLRIEPETGATFDAADTDDVMRVSFRIPRELARPGGELAGLRLNVMVSGLASRRAPRLAGPDAWAFFRPYMWGIVTK